MTNLVVMIKDQSDGDVSLTMTANGMEKIITIGEIISVLNILNWNFYWLSK